MRRVRAQCVEALAREGLALDSLEAAPGLSCPREDLPQLLRRCLRAFQALAPQLGLEGGRLDLSAGAPWLAEAAREACRPWADALFTAPAASGADLRLTLYLRDGRGRELPCGELCADADGPGRARCRGRLFGVPADLAELLAEQPGPWPWPLAPEQVRVLPVSQRQTAYAREVLGCLQVRAGLVTEGPLAGRVRAAHRERVPEILVVGERERATRQVARRTPTGSQLIALEQLIHVPDPARQGSFISDGAPAPSIPFVPKQEDYHS